MFKGSILKSVSRLKLGVKILNLNTWKEREEVERKLRSFTSVDFVPYIQELIISR